MKVDMFLNFTLKSYLPDLLRILHYVVNDISGIHFILRFLPHRASCEVIVYLTRYSQGEGSVNIYNPGLGSSTQMDTKYKVSKHYKGIIQYISIHYSHKLLIHGGYEDSTGPTIGVKDM